jgi:subtilisin
MRKENAKVQNFILLPASQMDVTNEVSPETSNFLFKLSENSQSIKPMKLQLLTKKLSKSQSMNMKVLDSIHENGAKLVQMDNSQMANFRFSYPGFRIIPEVFYKQALAPRLYVESSKKSLTPTNKIKILVASNKSNLPVKNATVVAFTNFNQLEGAQGKTNSHGVATLKSDSKKFERIYIYPEHSFWPWLEKNIKVSKNSITINLEDIDLSFIDSLRFFYKVDRPKVNGQIKVGVIDTGVGPHVDINLIGGANTIVGENDSDFIDNGEGHGTHVAGIIGANGKIKGTAAGVQILSYRVFPVGKEASNFYIMKAIDKAIADGCDLINMSLGQQGGFDEGVVSSIKDAYSKGTLCFAAAGNDGRQKVSFPAFYSLAIAVTAMGRKGTYPPKSEPVGSEAEPFGSDSNNYIADFSNIGNEVDFTAPGVGIISTFPNQRYAIMSGTSMACPAATGTAARLLSSQTTLLEMPRNQQRTDAMIKFLSQNVQLMGFGEIYEGMGLLK